MTKWFTFLFSQVYLINTLFTWYLYQLRYITLNLALIETCNSRNNINLSYRFFQKSQALRRMWPNRNLRQLINSWRTIKISINLPVLQFLKYLKSSRMIMFQRLNIINHISKNYIVFACIQFLNRFHPFNQVFILEHSIFALKSRKQYLAEDIYQYKSCIYQYPN